MKNKSLLIFITCFSVSVLCDHICMAKNAAKLIECINIANFNNKNDIIDLNNSVVVFDLTNYDGNNNDGINALPSILFDSGYSITIKNGHIIRSKNLEDDSHFRFFHIKEGGKLFLYNIYLENGVAKDINTENGLDGGAIFNRGTLGFFQTQLKSNRAQRYGGAVENYYGNISYIERSSFVYNESNDNGGAIDMTGGNIELIINSTFSHNCGLVGGALNIQPGRVNTIANSTFAYNKAKEYGGGIALIYLLDESASINNMVSNIVAKNKAYTFGEDIISNILGQEGSILFASYNLIGVGEGSDIVNSSNYNQVGTQLNPIDPKIGLLGYYGGATLVHSLLNFSTAIDRGNNSFHRRYDQRGLKFSRTIRQTDIGAFELNY